jgi:hypothetical protein
MIVRSKKTSALLKEGPHRATVSLVTGKPNDEEPKKVVLKFKVESHNELATREVPVSFEERSPLRKDTEAILGRQLTAGEAETGLDLQSLVGKDCQIVVTHKSGVGGRPVAAVSLVQPVPQDATPVNA